MSRICLVGGSGFVGRNIAELAVRDLHTLIIPARRRERAKRGLITLPTVDLIEADVHDEATLDRLFQHCDAVINLVGILHSRSGDPYGPDFARAHVELPRKIVAACERQGVKRLLHMSALGAAPDAPSEYLRSKAAGAAAVGAAADRLAITIFEPSVIFGPGDRFLTLFASLARRLPVLALGMTEAKFQPVYVEDVANAFMRALDDDDAEGRTFQLVGPKVYTLREIVDYAARLSGHPRPIITLPQSVGMLQARVLELLPGPLMSRDNLRSMQVASVSDAPFPFGIRPTPLEAIAPRYITPGTPPSRFDRFRHRAGRHA